MDGDADRWLAGPGDAKPLFTLPSATVEWLSGIKLMTTPATAVRVYANWVAFETPVGLGIVPREHVRSIAGDGPDA